MWRQRFHLVISAISECQSTPCHAWTGLTLWLHRCQRFLSGKSVQDSHYALFSLFRHGFRFILPERTKNRRAVSRSTCFSKHLTRLAFASPLSDNVHHQYQCSILHRKSRQGAVREIQYPARIALEHKLNSLKSCIFSFTPTSFFHSKRDESGGGNESEPVHQH